MINRRTAILIKYPVCILLAFLLFLVIQVHVMAYNTPIASFPDQGGYLGFNDWNDSYGGFHMAIDFRTSVGTEVRAVLDGEIIEARNNVSSFGGINPSKPGGAIIIRHINDSGSYFYAQYGHLNVEKLSGCVNAGERIGQITDYTDGASHLPHLHFGINTISPSFAGYASEKSSGGWTDPVAYLNNNCANSQSFPLIESIALSESEMIIAKGFTLKASITPADVMNSIITWSSNNLAVATVDQFGKVTPVAEGDCIITVSANQFCKKSASCKIVVKDFLYTVDKSQAIITGYTGTDKTLDIPNSLDGYPVVSIGDFAFFERDDLTGSLVIPDSVVRIGDAAFERCGFSGLLAIGSNVTYIGDAAFDQCGFTGNLTIPKSVKYIGEVAFQSNEFTGNLIIPDSVTQIGNWAFANCINFAGNVIIPDGIENIERFTFYNCSGLNGVTIPNSVTNIDRSAFRLCTSLTGIIIPDTVSSIGQSAFSDCSGLTGSIKIPSGVTRIDYSTFRNCTSLEKIYFPASVTYIQNDAFSGCVNLTMYVYDGSYSHNFAKANGIPYIVMENEPIQKLPGDANGDSTTDILDLVSIIDSIVTGTEPISLTNADANGDGTVDILDLVWIIDQIVGG